MLRLSLTILVTALLGQTASAAESLLEGTLNTRDLGGYLTADGLVVRKQRIFRSDDLSQLTQQDLATVGSWQLASLTDFRSESEKVAAPNRLPGPIDTIELQVNNPQLDISSLREKIFSGQLDHAELNALLDRKSYISNEKLSQEWGRWLNSFSNDGNLPHLFHCTAGKDRTGFAAAILLLSLGIPERRVMLDFLLSNKILEQKTNATIQQINARAESFDAEMLRPLLGVAEQSLDSALEEMRNRYGSIDNYIRDGLNIEDDAREKLRSNLLADPRIEGKALTGAEIKHVFSGTDEQSQVADANGTTALNSWHKDGTFVSRWRNDHDSGEVHGNWRVENDKRCVTINSLAQNSCSTIFEFEGQYFSVNSDGSIHGAHRLTERKINGT